MRYAKRTWGWYFTLWDAPHFKIKLLRFKKYAPMSYQYHNLRSELWLFLKGNGVFTKDDISRSIRNGESILIERGSRHSFRATVPTTVLEIQFGNQCIEKDIVRL